jgi:beta-galactosidase
MAIWEVPYQAGMLKAVGYTGNQQKAVAELYTAGKPVQIKLKADRTAIHADGQDLSYITVELLDGHGNRNPRVDSLVKFSIEGPGTIAGVANANPVSVESCQQPQRKAWQGRCLVIIRSGKKAGSIRLKAQVYGIKPVSIEIVSK